MRSALMLLLFIPLLLNSNPAAQTPAEPEKPLFKSTGNEATLLGIISLRGTLPKPKKIDMAADPICEDLNPKREPEWLLANHDKLLNAFVYVKGDPLNAYRFEIPATDVILQHVNCQFTPRVFGLRVGQNLAVVNSDRTVHNVHPTPTLNREWNVSQMPGSEPLTRKFDRQEALIPFKCNQHPWERAWLGVMNHPFFAISNELGSYEISGLPAGTYKLIGWHEAFPEQEVEITLAARETRRVDFTFDMDNLKKTWPYSPKD